MLEGQDKVEIAGRTYRPTPEDELTFEQYAYVQRAASKCGLGSELMDAIDDFRAATEGVETEEDVDEDAMKAITERILMRAFEGRAYLDLLAGVMVEDGKSWSREHAEETRDFFRGVTGKDNFAKLHGVLIFAVMGFFLNGLDSTTTSPRSSAARERLREAGIDPSTVSTRPKAAPAGASASESSAT